MEKNTSIEAKVVKDFDTLDMALQAYEYMKKKPIPRLAEFMPYCEGKMQTPLGAALLQNIKVKQEALKTKPRQTSLGKERG